MLLFPVFDCCLFAVCCSQTPRFIVLSFSPGEVKASDDLYYIPSAQNILKRTCIVHSRQIRDVYVVAKTASLYWLKISVALAFIKISQKIIVVCAFREYSSWQILLARSCKAERDIVSLNCMVLRCSSASGQLLYRN